MLSPGSYAFHDTQLLVPPLAAWKPISVSPGDTLRGLAFLVAFALLALAVFRELGEGRPRLWLVRTVVYTGLAISVVALLAGGLARAAGGSTASGSRAGTGPSSAPT